MNKNELVKVVKSAQAGDTKAFEVLFREFNQQVYYSTLLIVKNESLAEDITQETFITVIRKISELENPEAFPSWIKKVAHSKCSDFYKKKEIIHETTISTDEDDDYDVFGNIEEDDSEFIPDEALERDDLKKIVLDILNQLPDVQRSAILMRYYEDLSVKEIAEIQGVSEGTVMSRLNYGRKAIAKAIEDYEKENDIKLHSIPFIPFFHWVFEATKELASPKIIGNIASGVSEATGISISVASTGAGATAVATATSGATVAGSTVATGGTAVAGGVAAKIATIPLAAKIAAPIVAVAVAATPVAIKTAQKNNTENTNRTTATEYSESIPVYTDSFVIVSTSTVDTTQEDTTEETTEKSTLIVQAPEKESAGISGEVNKTTYATPTPTTTPPVTTPIITTTTTQPIVTTTTKPTTTQPTTTKPSYTTTAVAETEPYEEEYYVEYEEEEIYDDGYGEEYDENIFDIHDNPEDLVEGEQDNIIENDGNASIEMDGTLAY